MHNRVLMVSTCGTSLFTNIAGADADLRKLVIKHANAKTPDDVPVGDRQRLDTLISEARKKLIVADAQEQMRLSAEINGIRLFDLNKESGLQTVHWLIATGTWLGEESGQCISVILQADNAAVQVKKIDSLKTNDPESFREAVTELARLSTQEINGMREAGWHVVFNLTGGFKAVQGFMQALGMLYADEIVYVFERTQQLIRIPRLPVELDAVEIARDHQKVFRRLDAGLSVKTVEVENYSRSLYDTIEDEVDLSVWGKALWGQAKEKLLQEKLWPPVSSKLRFGPGFQKSVDAVCAKASDRLKMVNHRLLDLARHLEQPSYNPRSLDFKKLKGSHGSWTHECDAWSDADAKRLFGHFEGEQFVLEALEDHL